MLKQLLVLGLTLTMVGCGVDNRLAASTATVTSKAIAQQRTTEPIGPTDIQGELVKFEKGTSEHRFTVRLEDSSTTIQVLVPATITMRVVRGQFVGTGNGLPLSFLYDGAYVRLNLASPKGNPLRARDVYWDMTGIPI